MSIFGAMQSGISALASQSSSMGAISDNIANVNTPAATMHRPGRCCLGTAIRMRRLSTSTASSI